MSENHAMMPLEMINQLLLKTQPLHHWWGLDRLGTPCCKRCGTLRLPKYEDTMCRRNGG